MVDLYVVNMDFFPEFLLPVVHPEEHRPENVVKYFRSELEFRRRLGDNIPLTGFIAFFKDDPTFGSVCLVKPRGGSEKVRQIEGEVVLGVDLAPISAEMGIELPEGYQRERSSLFDYLVGELLYSEYQADPLSLIVEFSSTPLYHEHIAQLSSRYDIQWLQR